MDNQPVKTYCDFITTVDDENVHKQYHDSEYGFPIEATMNYLQDWYWR